MKTVGELFEVVYGHSLELNRLTPLSREHGGIAFVSRKMGDNGIASYVAPVDGVYPAPAGELTCALSGNGVLSTFLQDQPFYTGFHVARLKPLDTFTKKQLLYYCYCIVSNRYRYSYGRQANRTLKGIKLPSQAPDWIHSVDYVTPFTNMLKDLKGESYTKPATYRDEIGNTRIQVYDLFGLSYGNSLELNRLQPDSCGVNFVARTAKNNGVAAKVALPAGLSPIAPGCISVALSGSVLEAFVQQEPFLTGFHVMVLRPKTTMHVEELMFYSACIRANQWRYSYGRQANRTLKELFLPGRDSIPAWAYGVFAQVADSLTQAITDA